MGVNGDAKSEHMKTTENEMPTTEPRQMRADARRNYERLLAAANAAFAEHGPHICLDDIARSAEVGIGTLYRHFPNRQALLAAVYRGRIENLSAEAEELLNAPSPGDALASWLRSVLVHNITQRGLKEALMVVEGTDGTAAITECKMRLHAAGGALLVRAQEAGEIRVGLTISEVLRLVHGIAMVTDNTPDGPEQANRMLEVVIAGLRQQNAEAGA
jgi:AcrR family transcriptional regulator